MRAVLLGTLLLLAVCGCPRPSPAPLVASDEPQQWTPENQARLRVVLDEQRTARVKQPKARAVAVFDWDNTLIKNDIGDATFFWMLKHDKILQPPGARWEETSLYLSAEAAKALSTACGGLAREGQPLPTSLAPACADEILTVYLDAKTTQGKDAWRGSWNHRWMEPSYAWAAQLYAGYRPETLHAFVEDVITEQLSQPIGTTQQVGSRAGLAGYIRAYVPMRTLLQDLSAAGVEVWVVSASPQPVVETFAKRLGVPSGRVVGIRQLAKPDGTLRYRLEGCGPALDGRDEVITYMDGKRCWVNKAIFGDASPAAIEPSEKNRPVLAAGDADTDVTFLQDARFRVVIDRNKPELMCRARSNADGGWMIQPMFIAPRPAKAGDGACTEESCVLPDGSRGPCE